MKTSNLPNSLLQKMADQYGTPLYLYSQNSFTEPFQKLVQGLSGLDYMICFAAKANSNLSILKHFKKMGSGLDIVSGGELFRAIKAGFKGKNIVFSGVGKTPYEIEMGLQAGIYSFQVESLQELARIQEIAEAMGVIGRVSLRLNPDVNPKTHPYISTGLKKNKFGLPLSEVLTIAESMSALPNLKLVGLSIHIGSLIQDLAPFAEAFDRLISASDQVEEYLQEPLEFLDIGGGLGISYNAEKSPEISDYCKLIQEKFSCLPGKKILLEPGRLLSAEAGILLTRVLYEKVQTNKTFIVLDAGMNDLMRPALYQSHHSILPVDQTRKNSSNKAPNQRVVDFVGPVCETSDCFLSAEKIDFKTDPGSLLAIQHVGAYGMSMANNYNSRPRAAEVLVISDIKNKTFKSKVIRKRESFEDLIRHEL